MNLNYKTLGGDILIFKNNNDCMTISRGPLGRPWIDTVEVDGEEVDIFDERAIHPFTEEEIDYFTNNYNQIVGPNY